MMLWYIYMNLCSKVLKISLVRTPVKSIPTHTLSFLTHTSISILLVLPAIEQELFFNESGRNNTQYSIIILFLYCISINKQSTNHLYQLWNEVDIVRAFNDKWSAET